VVDAELNRIMKDALEVGPELLRMSDGLGHRDVPSRGASRT
jgi:hypothetical protein